ncbi:MAG: hypothetical protein MI785_02605 [Kiloniellales bacterium]|nr:hypothetical protein [Kiloniellales bacterium]
MFQAFDGALVTGVQMAADGTARIDFGLPDADNQRLRALEPGINDAIASAADPEGRQQGVSQPAGSHRARRRR